MTIDAMLAELRRRSGTALVEIMAHSAGVRVRWTDQRPGRGFDPMAAEAPTLREALRHALAWYAALEQPQPAEAGEGEEVARV